MKSRIAFAVVVGVTACGASSSLEFTPATTLSTPTVVGTAPMLAVAPDGSVATAWVAAPQGGTDGRLYVSINHAMPVEIRDSLGPIEGHGESPPELMFGADGALNVLYVIVKEVPGERFPLAALRLVRSADGVTWSAPVTVTGEPAFGAHNFQALHVAQDGALYAAWLGGDSAQSTAWIARSTDGGGHWASPVRVDTGFACPCCRTALASDGAGTLYMAWRHIYPGNVRDIVVARSSDHGTTWGDPVAVHDDDWVIDACPHAGPSLRVDDKGRVHVAWWTGKTGAAGVWYARSDDSGRTFAQAIPLGVAQFSRPAHVQLALAGPLVAATWDDGTLATPRIAFRLSGDDGKHFGSTQLLSDSSRAAGFPVVAIDDSVVMVAWSDRSRAAADSSAAMAKRMHGDPTMRMGIEPIGHGVIVMRRAVLRSRAAGGGGVGGGVDGAGGAKR